MRIKEFLDDMSYLITDLEIKPTTEKTIKIVKKILSNILKTLSNNEQKIFKSNIKEQKNRLDNIKTIDKELKDKLLDFQDLLTAFKVLYEEDKD